MLSVLELTGLSMFTFLRALPAVILFYLAPALLILFISLPVLPQFTEFVPPGSFNIHLFLPYLAQQASSHQSVCVAAAVFFLVYALSLCFVFFIVEGILNKERAGLYYIIPHAVASLVNLLAAFLAFFLILLIFMAVPVLFIYVIALPENLAFVHGALFVLFGLLAVVFLCGGVFFPQAAVLRGKGIGDVFYYSYRLIRGRGIRLIHFLVLALFINFALCLLVYIFNDVLIMAVSSLLHAGSAQIVFAFKVIAAGFCSFYIQIALTVYFLNMDYMINRDNKKLSVFSRVAAINDNSMPTLNR